MTTLVSRLQVWGLYGLESWNLAFGGEGRGKGHVTKSGSSVITLGRQQYMSGRVSGDNYSVRD